MSKQYDVIVIGSGIGGLTAASLLSKHKKVLVLEKNHVFGGYCADFKRGAFRFESAVQAINGLYKSNPVYKILKKANALDNLVIIKPKDLYRSIFPDYDINVPQGNIRKYLNLLCSLFPNEKNGLINLFSKFKSIYTEMERFYNEKSLKKSPLILRYGRRSLEELLDEFIKDKKLKAIISQYWMYRGLPPSKISAITFSYIWYDYTVNGSYFPREGMYSIVKNLIAAIKRNGGDVIKDKGVLKLLAKNGQINEVELNNYKRIGARSFISNIDVLKTLGMVENINPVDIEPFVKKIKKNTLYISACKIYLGLSVDLRKLGISNYEIFVNPHYDVEKMYTDSFKNRFDNIPFFITVYSNLSGAFCSKTKSVVSIGFLSGYDYWRSFTREEYVKEKSRMTDIMIKRCEKIIPNISKYIEIKEAATPLTMERYTANSKGSVYGWNKKSIVEEINFMNPTTPIKNLFLSSHWTKMGGGIGGVLLVSDRVCDLLSKRA